MSKIRLPYLLITIAAIILMHTSSSRAQDWETFRNTEFKFRFIYPPDWQTATPRGPNVRGLIKAPQNKPIANCSTVVRYVANLSKITQKELNNDLYSETWSNQDWEEALSDKFPDTVVYETKRIRVDNQPAQLAITGHSYETSHVKVYMKSMNFVTMTPGYFWIFGCGAGGESKKEADQSFKYWEPTFNKIFSSFVFERGLY